MVQLGKRGQFFILIMIFLVVLLAEIAVFTSESKQLRRQLTLPSEPGVESEMESYVQELKTGMKNEVYSGQSNYIETLITTLQNQSNRSGKDLNVSCTESAPSDNTYQLNCTLILTTSQGTFTETFSYEYALSTWTVLYSDSDRLTEEYYFSDDDIAYYTLYSDNNSQTYNVTVYNDSAQFFQENLTTTNYMADSSFTMSTTWPNGIYYVNVNGSTNATFYHNFVDITFTTENSSGTPTVQFERGSTVYWRLNMEYHNSTALNDVEYGIKIFHADGKPSEYNTYGTADSYGNATGSFVLSSDEPLGSMTILVTDYAHDQTDTSSIEVISSAPTGYITVSMGYTHPHNEVWAYGTADSGYTEWYGGNSTTHGSVPFTIGTGTNDTVLLNNSATFILPRVKAATIHFLLSGFESSDC